MRLETKFVDKYQAVHLFYLIIVLTEPDLYLSIAIKKWLTNCLIVIFIEKLFKTRHEIIHKEATQSK